MPTRYNDDSETGSEQCEAHEQDEACQLEGEHLGGSVWLHPRGARPLQHRLVGGPQSSCGAPHARQTEPPAAPTSCITRSRL